ncbi:L,D-transpeptidase family protein [Photobacterium alginatilyticum]|uniref:Amidase n=1 Tax=Photobacterium alginatilyticum TaxID=1775171 RepID=A0ABW9YLB1_9GAMM|nr:L,D-transpeptidase family protein [Photobacterium alginatilyticum]NBI54594.1 amidase [Photobacterium alginatilyticum]
MFKMIRTARLGFSLLSLMLVTSPVVMAVQSQASQSQTGQTQAARSQLDWQLLNKHELTSQNQLCRDSIQSNLYTYNVCFPAAVATIYKENDYFPIWADDTSRQELLVQLKSLVYADLVPGLDKRLSELESLVQFHDLRSFDLLATDSLLIYQAIIAQIQATPGLLFKHHYLTVPTGISIERHHSLSAASIKGELNRLRPQIKRFERSVALAERLRSQTPHQLNFTGNKRLIKEDQPIVQGHLLLDVLYSYGDISQIDYEVLSDHEEVRNTGEVTYAIKAFQRRNGLEDDGVIGPATARQLALPYSEVARVIALNLQRSRFGTKAADRPLIQVNIPDYMLRMTQQDQVLFESKVIVGRTSRPTYLFSSSLNTMVVNPYWNVPTTIKQEDVIPKVKESVNYLAEKNLKIVKSWRDRSVILPEQIEWSTVDPETFPYEFQQGPGPANALGKVKFLMPNDYSVFLHDTPARSLFNKKRRNFSSGCVRVEKADELAELILQHQRREGIAPYHQMVSDEQQDTVSLARRVNVDFMYLTAWVDENEQLQLREDIYGYDRPGEKSVEPQYITLKDFRY